MSLVYVYAIARAGSTAPTRLRGLEDVPTLHVDWDAAPPPPPDAAHGRPRPSARSSTAISSHS